MRSMTDFGNDLYTGKSSFPFVGRRRTWFIVAIVLVVLSAVAPFLRGGFEFSVEFTGGSQFLVSSPSSPDQALATAAVEEAAPGTTTKVTTVNDRDIRVQTSQLGAEQTQTVTDALATAYDVSGEEITASFIGPTWGQDVTRQSLWGLAIFLALTFLILAIYFRTWKMAVAAIVGLIVSGDDPDPGAAPLPDGVTGAYFEDAAPSANAAPSADVAPSADAAPSADVAPSAERGPGRAPWRGRPRRRPRRTGRRRRRRRPGRARCRCSHRPAARCPTGGWAG